MAENDVLRSIMPCGCVCYTCSGCGDGVIAFHARELLRYLEGMEEFCADHSGYDGVASAMRTLRFWAAQNCPGCRENGLNHCTYENCKVCDCSKKHDVDFCYMCVEYPCEKINSVNKWRKANDFMLKHGVQAYFEWKKQLSHYRDYKNPNSTTS